jgi:hypothetical protein
MDVQHVLSSASLDCGIARVKPFTDIDYSRYPMLTAKCAVEDPVHISEWDMWRNPKFCEMVNKQYPAFKRYTHNAYKEDKSSKYIAWLSVGAIVFITGCALHTPLDHY